MNIREQIAAIADVARVIPTEVERAEAGHLARAQVQKINGKVNRTKPARISRSTAKWVEIDGVRHQSAYAASLRYHLSESAVLSRCESAKWTTWHRQDTPKIIPKRQPRPCLIDGARYESAKLAGDAHDLDRSSVSWRCNSKAAKWEGWQWA